MVFLAEAEEDAEGVVVEEEDVELDVLEDVDDDVVEEIVLLLVEVVIEDVLDVMELGFVVQLLDMNGIDMEVSLEVGMTGVVGRMAVVGITFDIVGTTVPGTVAEGVHWKPLGTSVGMSVPVYVTNIGTTTPVGAT